MSKYTPGPWMWNGYWLDPLDAQATILQYTTDDDGVHAKQADKALIAAAPDMYEFIELYAYAGNLQTFEDRVRFREKAHELLAKAGGES